MLELMPVAPWVSGLPAAWIRMTCGFCLQTHDFGALQWLASCWGGLWDILSSLAVERA